MLLKGGWGDKYMIDNAKLKFVTSNEKKAEEIVRIADDYGLRLEVKLLKVTEIQSDSLEEIVVSKCKAAYNALRSPCFVEDVALTIPSLNDFPGPYSSYVLKTIGIEGLVKLMEGRQDRNAVFTSMIGFHGKSFIKTFKGVCKGFISYTPRGTLGWGYDPIFVPAEGDGRTFAEMGPDEKNKISHRARSLREMVAFIRHNKCVL